VAVSRRFRNFVAGLVLDRDSTTETRQSGYFQSEPGLLVLSDFSS
jgi:hypothetical protein